MSRRGFPPGVGWLPVLIASAIVLAVSAIGLVPNYGTRVIGTVGPRGGSDAPGTQTSRSNGGPSIDASGRLPSGSKVLANAASGCTSTRNGGSTAPGVTATQINIASTIVKTGEGGGFLKEAVDGIKAAINEVNRVGGICGRRLSLTTNNSGWDGPTGQKYIDNYISSGKIFALVGEPDSEGLSAAIRSGLIDRGRIPVVGTDGMLKDQYNNPWVWPVAASTVTNMHIIAQHSVSKLGVTKPSDVGIVFDTRYKFGPEGAQALDHELRRLLHSNEGIPGYTNDPNACDQQYCGISSDKGSYTTEIASFNQHCTPCKVVVMLLEPRPMETWMQGEQNAPSQWYEHLIGGEPLFDDNVAENCPGCGGMIVWTGYHPAIQPFDDEKAVYGFCHSLKSVAPADDCHNEFTEGAYLGTKLFIEAVRRVGPNLTRAALKHVLDTQVFDLGLTAQPLRFGTSFPRPANTQMAAFQDNYSGSFNGWSYLSTGFVADPHPGRDLQ